MCWKHLDKPYLCCQRSARLGMRLAKDVDWERAVKVSCNQSLTWMYLEVELTKTNYSNIKSEIASLNIVKYKATRNNKTISNFLNAEKVNDIENKVRFSTGIKILREQNKRWSIGDHGTVFQKVGFGWSDGCKAFLWDCHVQFKKLLVRSIVVIVPSSKFINCKRFTIKS